MFIGGYAVYLYLRTTNCNICIQLLTEDKDIEITDATKYDLLIYIDRGSLKWPTDIVIESIVILWKIFIKIDEDEAVKKQFYSSPSRKVLVQLAESVIVENYSENWRKNCHSCNASGWNILRKILGICTNCILANKVRNINSQIASGKKDTRKIKKFKFI